MSLDIHYNISDCTCGASTTQGISVDIHHMFSMHCPLSCTWCNIILHHVQRQEAATMDGISVRELLEKRSHLFNRHPIIAGGNGINRLITNVNVMEVPDIYGQVRSGDFLLTTGYSIRDNIFAQEHLILGLAERNITAIAIKMKRYINELPYKMLEQAEQFGVPIISLSSQINFSMVISEVLEEILQHKSQGIEQAYQSSLHLTHLLIMGESMQTFMESVSMHLGRKIGLMAEGGVRIGVVDDWEYPRYGNNHSSNPSAKQAAGDTQLFTRTRDSIQYIWYPIGQHPEPVGYLIYEDTEPKLSTSQWMLLQHAAKLLVLKLANLQGVKHLEENYKEMFLRKWILGEILEKESILSHASSAGISLQAKYVLLIASYENEIPNKRRIIQDISFFAEGILCMSFDQQLTILIPGHIYSSVNFSIHDIFKQLAPKRYKFPVKIGISSEKPVGLVFQAYKEAKESLLIYSLIDPERLICFYEDLGIYTMLYKISNQEELIDPTLGILKPLFRDGPKNKNELLDTLNCYVYQNGNIKETAAKLYCHYNSVLYRLERIETILGISVREPEQFFHVQFAVRLLSFIKQYKPSLAQQYLP